MRLSKTKTAASKSKKARLEGLLGRPRSATVGQLQKALDWQLYTIRAAISCLRKDGTEITVDRSGKTPAYRIDAVTRAGAEGHRRMEEL